ncbi:MAG: class I SAM-dependent RNA methyltransferase [Treponema sp.]|nr:class I SAM-dependent RNA methyltransferase [Treponema sp.]
MTTGDVYKLRLESIAPGGDALGRLDGKPVFVKGGAPDETVLCSIAEERKTWARAKLLEITEPSPVRTEKTCPSYGKCGGCNLQHIEYNAQLAVKTNIIKDSFRRIGGFVPPDPEIFSSSPWEYRNRMQFHCARPANGEKINFGLKGDDGKIIDITDCPVAVPGIRELLHKKEVLPLPLEKDRFTVFCKDAMLLSEGGRQRGKINILEKEILLDAGLFFQSNCSVLEKLILELQKTAEGAEQNLPMADLYCGVGLFAFFLGGIFTKTVLAEENKSAVSLARENLKGTNAEFFALRDTEWPRAFLRKKDIFGFAVIDPPRTGLAPKLASAFAQDGPPVLAYVSCDPSALARDSKILTGGGYKIQKLAFFDFYPQTSHIESLAVFTKQAIT